MATALVDSPEYAALPAGDKLALKIVFQELALRGVMPNGERLGNQLGPQNDLELLEAVEQLTGYRIPRATVCTEHNHIAPAQTFCDLYFGRIRDVIWIGNRGGGKTTNSGFLHGAKCKWHPAYKSAIAGAQKQQGLRAYAEFKRFIRNVSEDIVDTLISRTNWTNLSETEVLGGTVAALNGPHPHFAQMDEFELSKPDAFEEFKNMAQGDMRYFGQQLLTTTRKRAYGLVQQTFNEVDDAIREGNSPPWDINIFCVFETMAPVKNCRSAPENAGKPEEELCNCNKIQKGYWPQKREEQLKPRTFESVCGGRAARADGFVKLEDVHKRFMQLSQFTWESQQECLRPNVEGIVHKWVGARHKIKSWLPFPHLGSIYRGWDWGGQNPHAVVWCQLLDVPVGLDKNDNPVLEEKHAKRIVRTIKEGTLVQFDETVGNADKLGGYYELGQHVAKRQVQWWKYGFSFQVEGDYCDPAGFAAKRDVKKAWNDMLADPEEEAWEELIVPNFKSRPIGREVSIREHISWGESDRIHYVPSMCPRTDEEYDTYHWKDPKPGKPEPEDAEKLDDHCMDAKRYLIYHLKLKLDKGDPETPAQDESRGRVSARPIKRPDLDFHVGPHPRTNRDRDLDVGSPVAVRQADSPMRVVRNTRPR